MEKNKDLENFLSSMQARDIKIYSKIQKYRRSLRWTMWVGRSRWLHQYRCGWHRPNGRRGIPHHLSDRLPTWMLLHRCIEDEALFSVQSVLRLPCWKRFFPREYGFLSNRWLKSLSDWKDGWLRMAPCIACFSQSEWYRRACSKYCLP